MPDKAARLLRFVAFPVMIFYTLLLHTWAVWMAFKLGSIAAGVVTLLLPVAAWFYWLGNIPVESVRAGFESAVGTWFLSAALLLAAYVANRKFTTGGDS